MVVYLQSETVVGSTVEYREASEGKMSVKRSRQYGFNPLKAPSCCLGSGGANHFSKAMSVMWRSGRAGADVYGDIPGNAHIDIPDLELAGLALPNRVIRFRFGRFDDAIVVSHTRQGSVRTGGGAGACPSARYAVQDASQD